MIERTIIQLALAASIGVALSTIAHAQAVRFVASNGNDANVCSRPSPCRTLQRAVNTAPAGGEVQILDSGEYGKVYIGKSLTISADGISATLAAAAAGDVGVIVNASGGIVKLRGLLITGAGIGARGVVVAKASVVHIEDCRIERFTSDGIQLQNINSRLFVAGSASRLNGGRGLYFLAAQSGGGLTIENSQFFANALQGIRTEGLVQTTLIDSVVSHSGSHGFWQSGGKVTITGSVSAQNSGAGFVSTGGALALEYSLADGNVGAGFHVGVGATGRMTSSTFTRNAYGVSNGGTIHTRQNNTVVENTTANLVGYPLTPLGPI